MIADDDTSKESEPSKGPRSRLCLLLGGARSGKSAFALHLAARAGGRVAVVATAQAWDDEMRARIERHRRERPSDWLTVEAPTDVGTAVRRGAEQADVVLVDCVGLLVTNLMGHGEEPSRHVEERVDKEIQDIVAAAGDTDCILVSNDVGAGVVPPYPSGRLFRDLLGRANQALARAADQVYWMVAGLPVEVKASGLAEHWERDREQT
jgi:adenosylcobinamide kinase/adenosylcobinamide-phosphate guanylyltransferase